MLDPNLLQDTTSNKIAFAIFDPLVKLDENLQPEPAVAESWDVSEDGKTVTFHLRDDATWSNGDPVTAGDYEYSWKRILSPELAAPYSYQLYGIEGAIDYNSCDAAKDDCDALRDAVGVKAVDDQTLEVTLTSEQPWFVQQSTHSAFLPVPQATIEEFGDKWTDPGNIVTNGPFLLDDYQPDATLVMSKNPDWRDADSVTLEKFDGRIIVDGTTAVQAFEAGEVDSLDEQIPTEEIARLKTTDDYQQYPGLLTQAYGFNVKNVTDVNQRRAMSLAVDRQTIIDNITQADEVPATSWTPLGMPGFDVINPNSPWTPATGDVEQAKQVLAQAQSPKTNVNVFVNESPGNKDIAVALQSMWEQIGIKSQIKVQEWQQFLKFLGPPPNNEVDLYRYGWVGDFVDAINFLELWTCDSGNNNSNFCDPAYDKVITEARATPDNDARYQLYRQAEDILLGPDGQVPFIPLYYGVYTNLENASVRDTLNINLLDQTDWTKVVKQEG